MSQCFSFCPPVESDIWKTSCFIDDMLIGGWNKSQKTSSLSHFSAVGLPFECIICMVLWTGCYYIQHLQHCTCVHMRYTGPLRSHPPIDHLIDFGLKWQTISTQKGRPHILTGPNTFCDPHVYICFKSLWVYTSALPKPAVTRVCGTATETKGLVTLIQLHTMAFFFYFLWKQSFLVLALRDQSASVYQEREHHCVHFISLLPMWGWAQLAIRGR